MVAATTVTDEARAGADLLNRTFRALPPTIEQFIDDPYYLGLGPQCCDLVRDTCRALFAPARPFDSAVLIPASRPR